MTLAAAVGTLFGEAGLRVAVIAIVPIVLLTPRALEGIRGPVGGRPEPPTVEVLGDAGTPS